MINRRNFFLRTLAAVVAAPAALLAAKQAPAAPISNSAQQWAKDRQCWLVCVEFYCRDAHYQFIPTNPTQYGEVQIVFNDEEPHVLVDGNPFDAIIKRTKA